MGITALKEQLIVLSEIAARDGRETQHGTIEWAIHKGYLLGLSTALGAIQEAEEDCKIKPPMEGGLFTEETE